jgi:hypothetical protein
VSAQRGAFLPGIQVCLAPGAEQEDAPFSLAELAGGAGVHVKAERASVEHRAADLDEFDEPLVQPGIGCCLFDQGVQLAQLPTRLRDPAAQ